MMGQSGYSSTPLPRKLGLKEGQAVAFVGLPQELSHLADEQAFAFVETPAADVEVRPFALLWRWCLS